VHKSVGCIQNHIKSHQITPNHINLCKVGMDRQRAKRKGRKPTHWMVIPIKTKRIVQQLREVQEHLEDSYKHHRHDLRSCFSDLERETHITLFGLCVRSKEFLARVKKELEELAVILLSES